MLLHIPRNINLLHSPGDGSVSFEINYILSNVTFDIIESGIKIDTNASEKLSSGQLLGWD